jgi:hypothetical protein
MDTNISPSRRIGVGKIISQIPEAAEGAEQ